MHPQVRQSEPGLCPICNMDLVPIEEGGAEEAFGPRGFATSEAARQLMNIQTAPVERKFVMASVRMTGKVDYDETRLGDITAWVPGRLDRLYVDFTGIQVRKGDHMVFLYSPELIAAQQELLEAKRASEEMAGSTLGSIRERTEATVDAARERLRLWGLSVTQIEEIEKRGTPSEHVTIYAPMGGTVIRKDAREGMYVQTGTRIYTIADLTRVWVRLDAYESDLEWLRYGQDVEFSVESYPGELFHGRISLIEPFLDAKSRTVRVRVDVSNPDLRLKPGMFVRAVVRAKIAAGGRVVDPYLAGKWICPMHPEVIRDSAGNCDVCGMSLEKSESLGYLPLSEAEIAKPLVIPASAPLITGVRAVVYVMLPNTSRPTYEGREIVLGPRAGDYYIVRSGVSEGERVVTQGSFKIDSALQIRAKPSMMNPEEGAAPPMHHHDGMEMRETEALTPTPPASAAEFHAEMHAGAPLFRDVFREVVELNLELAETLSEDDEAASLGAARRLAALYEGVDMNAFSHADHLKWTKFLAATREAARRVADAADIRTLREAFRPLSENTVDVLEDSGSPLDVPLYVLRCPMAARGEGALWLQLDQEVRNPYFGAAMFRCGEVIKTLLAKPRASGEDIRNG